MKKPDNNIAVIDYFQSVCFFGRAKRFLITMNDFLILDESLTEANKNQYYAVEIKPFLFRVTKGDREWYIGADDIIKKSIFSSNYILYGNENTTKIVNSLKEIVFAKKVKDSHVFDIQGEKVSVIYKNGVYVKYRKEKVRIQYYWDAYRYIATLFNVFVYADGITYGHMKKDTKQNEICICKSRQR